MIATKLRRILLRSGLIAICGAAMLTLVLTHPWQRAKPRQVPPARLARTTNILLIGSDAPSRIADGSIGQRTDVLILVSCDPSRRRATLLSIPRDTLVDLPGHGRDRINLASIYGGIPLTRQIVTRLTSLKIDRHAAVDFRVFAELVDLLGGVEIEVDKRMYYRDRSQDLLIDLKKGRQVLTGQQALSYVRYRHDPLGDLARVQRQQRLIGAMLDKMRRERLWTKVIGLYRLKRRYVRTDLSLLDLYKLRGFARGMTSQADLAAFTVPGGFSGPCWAADEKALAALIDREFRPVKAVSVPNKPAAAKETKHTPSEASPQTDKASGWRSFRSLIPIGVRGE